MNHKILMWPDPKLKIVSAKADLSTPEAVAAAEQLALEMIQVMRAAQGAGLAAIQIGLPTRILVTDSWALFNPKITVRSPDTKLVKEGCLSLPGVFETVRRATAIEISAEYQMEFGTSSPRGPRKLRLYGLQAQVIQHEMEHLDGKFFLDNVSPMKRARVLHKLQTRVTS